MFYLFDELGFYYGAFVSMQDAIEEMENWGEFEDMFITTNSNPWDQKKHRKVFF